MSLAFLSPAQGPDRPPAESPFADVLAAAGAVFDVRDGRRVPIAVGDEAAGRAARAETVVWADASHLVKLEVQGAAASGLVGGLTLGTAVRAYDAWWCLVEPTRALVLADAPADVRAAIEGTSAVDVTTQYCALRVAGPAARELFARFCALDLREDRTPVAALRPGSVARTPGLVIREREDQWLVLVGAAYAEYFWTVVSDTGARLGGRAVGTPALVAPDALEEAQAHA